VHVLGVSLSFKGELGKPIQITYRGGFLHPRRDSASRILSVCLQDEALREQKVLLHCLHRRFGLQNCFGFISARVCECMCLCFHLYVMWQHLLC